MGPDLKTLVTLGKTLGTYWDFRAFGAISEKLKKLLKTLGLVLKDFGAGSFGAISQKTIKDFRDISQTTSNTLGPHLKRLSRLGAISQKTSHVSGPYLKRL